MNSLITIATFVLFLIIFLWVGAVAAQASTNTDEDYLLGNRSFGKFFVALSAGATGNSGWIMIGAVGMAYNMGISALLMVFPTFLGELIFWTFFPEKINQFSIEKNSQTVPEFIGSVANKSSGKRMISLIVAIITIIFIGVYTSGQFTAAAKTLDVFFGVNLTIATVITASSILIYCVTGGIRASIWTDIVQAFIVMFVSFGMLIIAIIAGGGVGEIISQLNSIDPNLMNITSGFTNFTLVAYLIGFFFFGFGFDISQPQVLVRLLAGKNPREVKQARWIYLFYVYSTWIAMLLFGVICRAIFPNLQDPEQALPLYAIEHFNPFFVGIVLAGIFSVIASSADSQLLVCSSALARDISPYLYRKMSGKYGVKYEQGMTFLVGVLAVIVSLAVSSTVSSVILFASGAVAGSLGPAMLIILIKRRTHYLALSSTILVGLLTAIIWRILGFNSVVYEICPAFIISLVVHELLMRSFFQSRENF